MAKTRNWHSVNAKQRACAGPMHDRRTKRKEQKIKEDIEDQIESEVHPEEIDAEYCETMDLETFYDGPCWCSRRKKEEE